MQENTNNEKDFLTLYELFILFKSKIKLIIVTTLTITLIVSVGAFTYKPKVSYKASLSGNFGSFSNENFNDSLFLEASIFHAFHVNTNAFINGDFKLNVGGISLDEAKKKANDIKLFLENEITIGKNRLVAPYELQIKYEYLKKEKIEREIDSLNKQNQKEKNENIKFGLGNRIYILESDLLTVEWQIEKLNRLLESVRPPIMSINSSVANNEINKISVIISGLFGGFVLSLIIVFLTTIQSRKSNVVT